MSKAIFRVTALSAWLLASVLACARAPAADPDRVALEGAIRRWTTAVNARDLDTLTVTMTEDVELSDGKTTISGREAAMDSLRELASRGKLLVTTREISIHNDLAWHAASLAQRGKSGDVLARGQTLEIWQRTNGQWKLHRRMAGAITPDISVSRPSTKEPHLDRSND